MPTFEETSNWQRKKLLILGLTYPSYSRKYVETTCVGGLDPETHKMIRIHPVPRRYMDPAQRFKSWQWITVDCQKNDADPRPESLRVRPESVELGEVVSSKQAAERASLLRKSPHLCKSITELKERQRADGTSLGIIQPKEIKRVYLRNKPATARDEWMEKERELLSQQTLPMLRPTKPLDFPEVDFMVEWVADDPTEPVHKMSLKQWGLHELYRKYDDPVEREEKVVDAMKRRLDLDRYEVFFFLGNFRSRLYQFGLMDSYSVKRAATRQASLFG